MATASDYKGYTLAELNTKIAKYDAAIDAVLGGAQSYTLDGQSFTRASIGFLEDAVNAMRNARNKKNGTTSNIGNPTVRRFGDRRF